MYIYLLNEQKVSSSHFGLPLDACGESAAEMNSSSDVVTKRTSPCQVEMQEHVIHLMAQLEAMRLTMTHSFLTT